GLEYWYNDLFAFRTGFFSEDPYNGNRKFLTFGARIRYNLIGVHCSYIYPLEANSPRANQLRPSPLQTELRWARSCSALAISAGRARSGGRPASRLLASHLV